MVWKTKNSADLLLENLGPDFRRESFCNLVSRRWFSRMWVVQEVALRENVVFHCGKKELGYDHLRAAYFLHILFTTKIVRKLFYDYENAENELRILKSLESFDISPLRNMLMARLKYHGKRQSLYDLRLNHKASDEKDADLEATNPRDMIYELLV